MLENARVNDRPLSSMHTYLFTQQNCYLKSVRESSSPRVNKDSWQSSGDDKSNLITLCSGPLPPYWYKTMNDNNCSSLLYGGNQETTNSLYKWFYGEEKEGQTKITAKAEHISEGYPVADD